MSLLGGKEGGSVGRGCRSVHMRSWSKPGRVERVSICVFLGGGGGGGRVLR